MNGSPNPRTAWSTSCWYGCPNSNMHCLNGENGDWVPSRGRARSLMAKTGCPFPMVRRALGFMLSNTNRTYLALLRLSLASRMGIEMQNRPSDWFFTKGGPG
jgi:hypothetical protein